VDRRAKVELFEQIRREYEHGGGTIRGIAKKLGIHRRMVREPSSSTLGNYAESVPFSTRQCCLRCIVSSTSSTKALLRQTKYFE